MGYAQDATSNALEGLVTRFSRLLRQVGRRRGLTDAETGELCQEVRIRIWYALATGEGIAHAPASYVYRAALSAALEMIRRHRARREEPLDDRRESEDRVLARVAVAPECDGSLAGEELAHTIARLVSELAEPRDVVVRMYLAGYNRREVAGLLGWTEAKVRNLLYRGLADLRTKLTAVGVGPRGPVGETELRRLYARIATRRAPVGRAGCVAPEMLLSVMEAGATEAERLQALRHVAACGSCRADRELLRSAADAARGLKRRSVPAFAIAASLVILAGAAVVWRSGVWRGEPMRGPGEGVTLLRPSGDVAALGPLALAWRSLPLAARYDVQVVDARGRVLFTASTRDTTAPLSTRADLIPGAEYYWSVQALRGDGSAPRSRAQRFRIRPQ